MCRQFETYAYIASEFAQKIIQQQILKWNDKKWCGSSFILKAIFLSTVFQLTLSNEALALFLTIPS